MRKISILFILLLSVVFMGCPSEPTQNEKNRLITVERDSSEGKTVNFIILDTLVEKKGITTDTMFVNDTLQIRVRVKK